MPVPAPVDPVSSRALLLCLHSLLTSNLELHISPMKLLLCAILTASLTDVVVRPLLYTGHSASSDIACSMPRSLHKSTGSAYFVSRAQIIRHQIYSQLGCFQLSAVQMFALYDEKTIDLMNPSLAPLSRLA